MFYDITALYFLQNYLGVHFTINIGKITDNLYLRWFD